MVGTPDPPLVPVSPHKAAPSSVFTAEEAGQGTQGGAGAALSGAGRIIHQAAREKSRDNKAWSRDSALDTTHHCLHSLGTINLLLDIRQCCVT